MNSGKNVKYAGNPDLARARNLALIVPLLLLGGAYIAELWFGLFPCEMCWWQRWPHFAALALALLSYIIPPRRLWVALAAAAILISGLIGAYHAGVEYDWWEGVTACAAHGVKAGESAMDAIMRTPMQRCDTAPWSLFGISLAGWNFVLSTSASLVIFALLVRGSSQDAMAAQDAPIKEEG